MTKWYKITKPEIGVDYSRAFLVSLCRENCSVTLYWEDKTVSWDYSSKSFFNYYTQFLAEAYKQIEETEAVALLL